MISRKNFIVVLLFLLIVAALVGCGKTNSPNAGNGSQNNKATSEKATYPSKPIKILVPQQAGSSLDITTRIMAEYAQGKLGQPVVVENVIGAGGRAAYTQIFNAKPDGYTLSNVNVPSLPIGEMVFQGKYKSDEFSYIYGWADTGHVLVVKKDSPIKDFNDLVKKLKSERVTIGTFGKGTSSHLQMAVFLGELGEQKNGAFVHFEGGSQALAALIGGDIQTAIVGYGAYAKTTGLRALVAFSKERDPMIKDVPTIGELGYGKTPIMSQIMGVVGPPGLPKDIVKKLSDAFDAAAKDPQVKEKFNKVGLTVSNLPAEEFSKQAIGQYNEIKKYADMLK